MCQNSARYKQLNKKLDRKKKEKFLQQKFDDGGRIMETKKNYRVVDEHKMLQIKRYIATIFKDNQILN